MTELIVRTMRLESDAVLSLELEAPDGAALPAWEPGAHLDLTVGDRGVRQYSLCGPQDASSYRVAVLLTDTLRGGSDWVHTSLRPGDTVATSEPRNHFALEPADRYVLVAGGIGITPLLAMAERLDADGADWSLVYGGRTRRSMAFLAELERYGDRVLVVDESQDGPIDLQRHVSDRLGEGVLVYCCGPAGLLDAVAARCAERPDRLRVERFAAPASDPADAVADDSFEVHAERSGVSVTVGPGVSIVDALETVGVRVDTSCRDGICGTCETKVLAGRPDHRDYVLSSEEQAAGASMMLCVSRASSRLVLDL